MDKTLLVDLKKKIFIRSALIALNSLDEILSLNENLSADEIFLEIIKKATREYEHNFPLILEMKLNKEQMGTCYGMEGFGEIKSNFTLYLDCAISEDQIVLVPNSLPSWRPIGISYPAPNSYSYCTEYRKPYLYLNDLTGATQFYLRGICSRPIIPDFLPDKTFNPVSGKGAVYWMDIEDGSAKSDYYINLCLTHVLDYIRQLKASIQVPGIGIDVMGNVDMAYQELRARCDQFALQSSWYGDLLI
jgi:hypothetical protein